MLATKETENIISWEKKKPCYILVSILILTVLDTSSGFYVWAFHWPPDGESFQLLKEV